jgi:hypothetical protein
MKSVLGNARKPDIIFHASGKIDITSGIVSRLRLSVGDVIDILTDDDEFYLYVKHRSPMAGKYEGRISSSGKYGRHCRIWSVRLSKVILEECNVNDVARLTVGELVKDNRYGNMLPIITKHLL